MAVVAVSGKRAVQIGFVFRTFRQGAFRPFIEHTYQRADNFKVAQLFGSNVHQHILATRIVIAQALCEISACGGEFALRAAELLQKEISQPRIRFRDPDGILKLLNVSEHRLLSLLLIF